MSTKHIAIVGGGIAGLVAAAAIGKRHPDTKIDVHEGAHAFGEIGLGLGMWPRIWEVLGYLGLDEDFDKIVYGRYFGADEGTLCLLSDVPQGETMAIIPRSTLRMTSFHRQDLQRVLLERLACNPNCTTYVGHRLSRYEETPDGVHLTFENGETASADLLIGADGIRSAVKSQLMPGNDPVYLGKYAYRGLIPVEKLDQKHGALWKTTLYCGKHIHIIAYKISQGRLLNVVVFIMEPDIAKGTAPKDPSIDIRELLKVILAGWEDEVQEIVEHFVDPIRFPIFALKPTNAFIAESDRVVLLGDAAHAMPPHLGAGAGQAIEDAYVLSAMLDKPRADALKLYDSIRRPYAHFISESAGLQGALNDFVTPGKFESVGERDKALHPELKNYFAAETARLYAWSYSHPKEY